MADDKTMDYKYYWIKLADEQHIADVRRTIMKQVPDHPDEAGLGKVPLGGTVVPPVIIKSRVQDNLYLGVLMTVKEAETKGWMPLTKEMGSDRGAAEQWIGTKEGQDWAKDQLCVLMYAAAPKR
jgi:hypothetical protein